MELKNDISRAQLAEEIKNNSLFNEALNAYELEIINQWKQSHLKDVEWRERLRMMLEASNQLKAFLHQTIASGNLAMHTIRQQSLTQKAKKIFGMN